MYRGGVRRVLAAAVVLLLASCSHRERRFESVCQIVRTSEVEEDETGKVTQFDVEMEWDPCPGDQFQVVRGGAEFAECMKKHEAGEYVPVKVVQNWDTRGYYVWDVEQVADCPRPPQPGVHGSYEKSQECNETKAHGHTDGFACSRKPFRQLISICPWMARE